MKRIDRQSREAGLVHGAACTNWHTKTAEIPCLNSATAVNSPLNEIDDYGERGLSDKSARRSERSRLLNLIGSSRLV